ncbi:diaminopimelate epimerase [Dongia deserti]|uniref:diaminopimelate epimerase n=1 Tax=Dongia deserti TaxID=2268030 RepID=UPI000E64E7E8|nr:diaminopimelate epimerase [Dongia deserti]
MIPFARMHGSGNDFAVVDDRAGRLRPHRRALAQALCDRRRGLGGDGLVLLSNGSAGHVVMSYINADGNDGEMCGNGAGCAVRRAWELRFFQGSETVLDTDAGAIGARIDGFRITMTMTDPQDERLNLSIPTSEGTLLGHYIDTGVPHVVLFVDDVAQANLAELGPEVRHHALFPHGCNVNWAARVDENSFRMRTYERGVEAETLSCGTGATAIALIAYRLGLAKPPVMIRASGGGTLNIEFDESSAGPLRNVRTTVEVERIAEGTIDADWLARRGFAL